jgi:ribulose-phosphate 3-epimerase
MKNKIIPAILVKKWNEIEREAKKFTESKVVENAQIDFCDGKFVPSLTWPFVDKEDFVQFEKVKEGFEKNRDTEIYLPEWETLSYSADLMCENPAQYFKHLLAYGFSEFIIHFRSMKASNLLLTLEKFEEVEKFCMDFIMDFSIAIDMKTDLEEFVNFGKKFENSPCWNGIQIMGIENIGAQGEVFNDEILKIVQRIKMEFPEKSISIDGGMNYESVEKCKKAGVTTFVVGSYLQRGDFKEKFKELTKI